MPFGRAPAIADRELQEAARAMIHAAQSGRPALPVLRTRCPHVARQIVQDRKHRPLLALWGRSVNVDENTGEIIVHPAILEAIGELAGLPMHGRFVHAGLQHTYGYLFSLIDTPYGRKRDRWLSTSLEEGFGLEPSLLGDRPARGTLLANLTGFLGRIVHRGAVRSVRLLQAHARAIAPQIMAYDYDSLRVSRIVEETGKIALLTDLVPYPQRPQSADAESALLIYSVKRTTRPLRLITAFPVKSEYVRELQASARDGGEVDIRLRYNAYVPGLYGKTVRGRRHLAPSGQN
jgi:hypothetical protein